MSQQRRENEDFPMANTYDGISPGPERLHYTYPDGSFVAAMTRGSI